MANLHIWDTEHHAHFLSCLMLHVEWNESEHAGSLPILCLCTEDHGQMPDIPLSRLASVYFLTA